MPVAGDAPAALAGSWMSKPGMAGLVMSTACVADGLAEARRGRPVDRGQDQGRGDDVVGAGVQVVAQQLGHRGRQVQPALRRADRPARADRAGVGRDAGEREVARRIGDGRGRRRS